MKSALPILFISSTRIGDAVLSSGLIKRLIEIHPTAKISIAAGPLAVPLFADTPGLANLWAMPKQKTSGHWVELWKKAFGTRWGLVVDTRGSVVSYFLNTKTRSVFRRPRPGTPIEHKVAEMARLLRLTADEAPDPYLFLSDDRIREAKRLTAGEGPILAVGPGANWIGKTWPSERFAKMAAEILGPSGPLAGGRLMILGADADREAAQAVKLAVGRERCLDFTGKLDLLTVYAVLKECRLYVGNDSGVMHLAAAAGTPTLGVFGPTDDRRYGPYGPKALVVRGPRTYDDLKVIDPHSNQRICHMHDLKVEPVLAGVRTLLAKTESPL